MEQIQKILETFDSWLWGNWLLFVLLGVGVLYTVITGTVQLRHFPLIMKKTLVEPVFGKKRNKTSDGAITSFQALCTALASCVGSGNIVGVATAVMTGGLGALFWMWVAAFVGMATKYGEIILGILYRKKDSNGDWQGGPMYYIADGLHMKWLANICAFAMVLQIISANFIQSNTVAGVTQSNFHMAPWLSGIMLTILLFIVVTGGLKRLAHITERLVPFMACLYVFGGLLIILINITKVPEVFLNIARSAFGMDAITGGVAGSMTAAMQRGISRGLYSNEAGEGSAPVIHSSADVEHPVQQGLTGVTEVFLDTFVICTITGLVLGVTGVIDSGEPASVLAIYAFASVWKPLRYLVVISLLLFCTSTLMGQWYFGYVGLSYLRGHKLADKFKYVFPLFCIFGAQMESSLVWTVQDIALAFLTLPNIVALLVLWPKVRAATKDFFTNPKYISYRT
ncbi:alanine/glycine:cation symporter family protein [Oribacterium sp. HCP28S3_H8]|uniref:alanine/glycine:cation symporter family protein n=1 Tax=Oribacterium sp. HCP28S3_H8 TaxID=3438945 RepID=UPI003F897507